MKRSRRTKPQMDVLSFLKIVVLACILTTVLVLLMAILLKLGWLGMAAVPALNTLIKAASAGFAGVMVALRELSRGWVLAGAVGVCYMVAAFAVFSILNGSFALRTGHITDVLMAFACASCACIFVSVLRRKKAQAD